MWDGDLGKSRKFAQKKHYGPDVEVAHVRGPVLDLNTVPDDRYRSLCVTDIGKLHFPPRYSGTMNEGEKPNKKMFKEKPSGHAAPAARKLLPRPKPPPERPAGKRDNPEQRMRRGQEILDPTALDVGWQHMRVVRQGLDQTGPPARARLSEEYNMEVAMNRKQRFKGPGLDPMNESNAVYSLARTSEVTFKPRGRFRENNQNPEYSTGYFAQGGLVPGSNIALRESKKPTLRRGDDFGGTTGRTMKTYKEIAAERERQYDLDQVHVLTRTRTRTRTRTLTLTLTPIGEVSNTAHEQAWSGSTELGTANRALLGQARG